MRTTLRATGIFAPLIFLATGVFADNSPPCIGQVKKMIRTTSATKELHKFSKERFGMRPEEDGGGLGYFASVDGVKPAELGYIQYHTWPENDGTRKIVIDFIHVNEALRGNGISEKLYREMLSRIKKMGQRPSKIGSEALTSTNKEAALKALMSELSSKPGYITPDPSLAVQQQFLSCCRQIFAKHPDAQLKAVALTPAHKAHSKLGFTKVCEGHFEITGEEVVPRLVSCLPGL